MKEMNQPNTDTVLQAYRVDPVDLVDDEGFTTCDGYQVVKINDEGSVFDILSGTVHESREAAERELSDRASKHMMRAKLESNVCTREVAALIVQCGGDPCGSCAQFPRDVWLIAVNDCACVLGYWEWVISVATDLQVDLSTLRSEIVVPTGNVDHCLVGECDANDEMIALWTARSFKFKLRRAWNVLGAFFRGYISARHRTSINVAEHRI